MRRYDIILSIVICIAFLGSILLWQIPAHALESNLEKAMQIGLGEERWNQLLQEKGNDFSKWRFRLFDRYGLILEALAGWRMGNGYLAMEKGQISSQEEFDRLWSSLTFAGDKSTQSTVKGIGIIGDGINLLLNKLPFGSVASVDSGRAERMSSEATYSPQANLSSVQVFANEVQIIRINPSDKNWENQLKENLSYGDNPLILGHGIFTLKGKFSNDFAKELASMRGYNKAIILDYGWHVGTPIASTKAGYLLAKAASITQSETGTNPGVYGHSDFTVAINRSAYFITGSRLPWIPFLEPTTEMQAVRYKEVIFGGSPLDYGTKLNVLESIIIGTTPKGEPALFNVYSPYDIATDTYQMYADKGEVKFGLKSLGENRNIKIDPKALLGGSIYEHSRMVTESGLYKTIPSVSLDKGFQFGNKESPKLYTQQDDPSKKYYGDNNKKYFGPPPPPPPPPGAIPGRDHPIFKGQGYPGSGFDYGHPGGILLDMPADVVGLNTAEVSGATWDDQKNQISLIVKGDVVAFPKTYLDDFVSILITVYGGDVPGISIDPGGYTDQCAVRYIGKVKNTRFGRTLFEADRLLKSLSLGKDTLTGYPINPGIPGFKTMVQLFEEKGMKYSGALYRFWFLPLEMKIKQHGNSFIFDTARLQVKSEYMFKKGKRSETEPAAEEFARFLTEHYDEFAYRYPVLRNLVEYAKMVSVALWLRERNVPLNWFMLANSWVENIPTPDVTPAMFSQHPKYPFEVWGGVDFRMNNAYLPATGLAPLISEAAISKLSMHVADLPIWNIGETSWNISGVSPGKTFEVKDEVYTAVGMPSSLMLNNGRKLAFCTDAVMHNSPRLELTRYFNADNPQPAEFGVGWSLFVPFKLEPADDKNITYQGVSFPERMAVIDTISNRKEVLKFESKKYVNVGYFPETETVHFKGLLLMSDASYVLLDRWGNSFRFDHGRRLMTADMGAENRWAYVYSGDRIVGMVNPEGSEIRFKLDQKGRVEKAVIANKGTPKGEITYVYDTQGHLVKVVGLDGKSLDYQYNSNHILLSLIPRHARWKTWQYVILAVLCCTLGISAFLRFRRIKRKNYEHMCQV